MSRTARPASIRRPVAPAGFALSATASAAMLMCLGVAPAVAQTTATPVETITVTGIRRGIESAINVKKGSDGVVEAISAEDIGKLPDSSIAESIARLPGVAAQRVGGRATEINIRGLSGDFANTLLNGREQVSTGNNRSVEFDQYPSELLSSVLIYKTPDAALVGQGLSGTIDLQTVKPLSFGNRVVAINLRGEKNGKGTPFEGKGQRFNFSYIDQFANRTVGIALGVARLSQNVTKFRKETYDENNTVKWDGTTVSDNNASNPGQVVTFNQGFKYFVDSTDETRDAAMAVFEFKPNKDLHSVVDIFYSKFDKEIVKRGIEAQMSDTWKSCCSNLAFQQPTLSNATITGGRLISGTWGNVNPLSRHIWEPRNDELKALGWNTKFRVSPKLQLQGDLSYSSASSVERITEMEAGAYDTTLNRPRPGTVTISNYNEIASMQYDLGNPAVVRLTDPESWGQNGYDKVIATDDKIKAARLSAQLDMDGMFSRLNLGANLTQRDKTKSATEAFLRLPAGSSSGAAVPAGASALAIPGTSFNAISFDPAAALGSYRFDANVNGDILRKGWTVNEDITTLFVKADIDTQLLGRPLTGNLGFQYVRSDQSSTAPVVDNTNQGTFTTRTAGKSYNDLLPTLNLKLDLGGDMYLKSGVGRQMARPRMDQLSAFSRSEVNNDRKWTGSGGNPFLDPFRATAFDLSLEKYFSGNKGYWSAALFYKDLKSYIFDFTNKSYNFTGFPNLSGRVPLSNIGEFTQPVNGKGGRVSGVELAVSVPLNLVAKALDGFGIQASISDTSSKIKPFGDADTRPLPGLSRKVTQLVAYYEKHGFSARVAGRERSEFIAEIEGFGADREYKYARGETVVDVQFGYEFQSGPAKGLSLLLQINNANNEPYREYDSSTGRDTKLDQNGRTYLFGLNYKF